MFFSSCTRPCSNWHFIVKHGVPTWHESRDSNTDSTLWSWYRNSKLRDQTTYQHVHDIAMISTNYASACQWTTATASWFSTPMQWYGTRRTRCRVFTRHVSAEDSAVNLEATQQRRRQAAQSVTAAPPSRQTLPPTTPRATCNSNLPPVMGSERRMHLQNAGPSVVRARLLLASHVCRVFVSEVLVHARRKVWTFQQYDINRRRSTVVHPAHLKTFLNEGQMRD